MLVTWAQLRVILQWRALQNIKQNVKRGRKTTIMLKSLATSSAYATKWGEPIQSYVETIQGLPITASAIYNFWVYAYNWRYKSKSVQILVQNRAVMRPEKPLYFSQIAQENVHVTMVYTNLAGQQSSGPEPGVASPSQAKAGMPTRMRVKFTPKRQINELETLDIHLPKFKGPGYLSINNDASILLLAHSYQPYGSDACLCYAEGRIQTPRNNYKITRAAEGNGSCTHSENNSTQRITGIAPVDANMSVPWCACGECDCSLSGQPITPATLYNTTGTCLDPHDDGVCSCDATGNPFTPPITYNATGDCSSCVCDSNGQSSYVPEPNVTCSCQCIPRTCTCECALFLKCSCGCELYRTHNCGCNQNQPDPVFQNAAWSSFTETLVLTLGPKKQLPANKEAVVWISSGAAITMPADGSYPKTYPKGGPKEGLSGLDGLLMRFKLNWISQFPSSSTPGLGFIIQFTSDLFWKTNVQTLVVLDNLDEGVVTKEMVAILDEPTTLDGEVIRLNAPARYLNGRYIQIEEEIMEVLYANATHPHLRVRRGQFSTPRAIHPVASGGEDCGCNSNGTSKGPSRCKCNGVQVLNMGATDFSMGGSLDFKKGFQGVKCRAGDDFINEGCNVQNHIFPYNIRTHQSAIISGMVTPSINFATACAGTASTCLSGNCACETPGLVTGGEHGNQRPRGNTSIVSSGNIMDYPVDFRTFLATGALGLGGSTILAVLDTDQLIGKYI